MRRPMLKSLLWQVLGVLFYLGGMLLFLFVAVNVFLSPPENSLENLSSGHVAWILVSLVLLVTGRLISWRFGAERSLSRGIQGSIMGNDRDASRLRNLGYNVPAETSDEQEFTYDDGDVYVVCSRCGTKNEQGYSYCSDCSAELPE